MNEIPEFNTKIKKMRKGEKVEINEGPDYLELKVKWFSPIAYFLVFFTSIWCGFLAFFYSMLIGSGEISLVLLFPILHVAVGLWLIYYTACLFFNKTSIDVYKDHISIAHSPIPWWRGNEHLYTRDFEQLFVKEKISQSNNGTTRTYRLVAKMSDGKDKDLLALDTLTVDEVQEIEKLLEDYLGIEDYQVQGEFDKRRVPEGGKVLPRKKRRDFSDSALNSIYHSREGKLININHEELKLTSVSQFDWNDGDSDKLFQLATAEGAERLLYLSQNKAFLEAHTEKSLSIFQQSSLNFQKESAPISLTFEGKEYFLDLNKKGNVFVSGTEGNLAGEQWVYKTEDGVSFIRMIDYQNLTKCFLGVKLSIDNFTNSLDLDEEMPSADIRYEERDFLDEDFV